MIEPFPFDEHDWGRIRKAAKSVVNAALMEDSRLQSSRFVRLQRLLKRLQSKYDNHPLLTEIEADFSLNPTDRERLYRQAIMRFSSIGLPTYTCRLSLAILLCEELNDSESALQELKACKEEVFMQGDMAEKADWEELLARCSFER